MRSRHESVGQAFFGFFLCCFTVCVTGQTNGTLSIRMDGDGMARLSLDSGTNATRIFDVERSADLVNWERLGRFLDAGQDYEDRRATNVRHFYVGKLIPQTASNQWANQFHPQATSVGKFLFLTNNPNSIFFHSPWMLHQQFAREQMPEFEGMSASAFDEIALYPSKQKVVLGGLHVRDGWYGIEFVTYEAYSPEALLRNFKWVASRMAVDTNRLVYVPNARERASVLANRAFFETHGMRIRELGEIYTNSAVQAGGWAIGNLKYVATTNLDSAIAAGEITRDTILVTDESPRDLPPVAGLISLTKSSPHSHTVLRLQSSLLPYLDLPVAHQSVISALLGKEVLLVTMGVDEWHLVEVTALTADTISELRGRQTRAVTPPPVERVGRYWTNVSFLKPDDVKHYGSKAANYGVVYLSAPGTLPGIGLSFDLWQDFMGQTMGSGKTLKVEIEERLAPFLNGTNMLGIGGVLDNVRDIIKDDAVFSAEQQAAIRTGLAIFNPNEKIRFRSSSNCEDLPKFSAAGLYDSYSGCLLDDELPIQPNVCRCDPQDDKRRSVFDAIRKVYASLYNDQAFLERRAFGIEESGVAMGVLVHRSFPDEIELANGVANVDFTQGGIKEYVMITQRGAVSVVNPEGPDLPEVVTGNGAPEFYIPFLQTVSTIRPPMTPVLEYPAEYNAFLQKFWAIAQGYSHGSIDGVLRLNFEFKKTAAGLFVKQVRLVYTGRELVRSVMLPAKYRLGTYQGFIPMINEQATIWATHALKSFWDIEVLGGVLSRTNSELQIYSRARGVYVRDENLVTNEYTFIGGRLISTNTATEFIPSHWTVENDLRSEANEEVKLRVTFPGYVPASRSIVKSTNLLVELRRPGNEGVVGLVRTDAESSQFGLWPHTRTLNTNGVTISTSFIGQYHPDVPVMGMGPTYDVREWAGTVISGLSTEPIILRGYFSQSYKPTRHNISEEFLFEPRLEEGISVQTLNELSAANIRQIYFCGEPCRPPLPSGRCERIELIGFDGSRRPL